MYYIQITFDDGHLFAIDNVEKIQYVSSSKDTVTIEGDSLLTSPIPVGRPFWVFSSGISTVISGNSIRAIQCIKE